MDPKIKSWDDEVEGFGQSPTSKMSITINAFVIPRLDLGIHAWAFVPDFAGEIADWQCAIPGFGVVSGPFQITALEYSGNHDGEVTFEIALESAGAVSFAEAG